MLERGSYSLVNNAFAFTQASHTSPLHNQ